MSGVEPAVDLILCARAEALRRAGCVVQFAGNHGRIARGGRQDVRASRSGRIRRGGWRGIGLRPGGGRRRRGRERRIGGA
jgi:hypothetical protein